VLSRINLSTKSVSLPLSASFSIFVCSVRTSVFQPPTYLSIDSAILQVVQVLTLVCDQSHLVAVYLEILVYTSIRDCIVFYLILSPKFPYACPINSRTFTTLSCSRGVTPSMHSILYHVVCSDSQVNR
jgi:hypothetical protein